MSHQPSTQTENVVLSDGTDASDEPEQYQDADAAYHLRREHTKHLPWWKRPSPWWVIGITPFTAIAMSVGLAPRIEIYTMLACSVHKPDIFRKSYPGLGGSDHRLAQLSLFPDTLPRVVESGERLDLRFDEGKMSEWRGTDGESGHTCASDPVVQAEVAKLTLVISTCLGILSCLTTGWWGSLSDRHGRTVVMGITVFGLLANDFNFIFVALNSQQLPGGYWFLVVGPILEGILGGFTASVAATHAYVADTTTEVTRSGMFSLSLGLMFTGFALGPSLGAVLIRFTGHTLSAFYATAALHLLYALLVWFTVPESLLEQQMRQSKTKYNEEFRDVEVDHLADPAVGFLVRAKRLFAFLSPLTIFFPDVGEGRREENPLKRQKKDWSLALIAMGYGLSATVAGSYSYKLQYAASAFGWTAETLGYWLSLVGAARAAFLTLFLPLIIKFLKPHPRTVDIPRKPGTTSDTNQNTNEQQPLLSRVPSSGTSSSSRPIPRPSRRERQKKEIHSTAFDMALARGSLFSDMISYTFMAFVSTSLAFTICTLVGSFGSGFSPAVQSVALAMYTRRRGMESGRLFAALSVVQALCSQIGGPALYGLVYMKTVGVFPRAIFFMTTVTIILSFLLLAFVRVPEDGEEDGGTVGV